MTAPPIAAEIIAPRTRAVGARVAAGQHGEQAIHELQERLVLREEPDDHGILLERAHDAAALRRRGRSPA